MSGIESDDMPAQFKDLENRFRLLIYSELLEELRESWPCEGLEDGVQWVEQDLSIKIEKLKEGIRADKPYDNLCPECQDKLFMAPNLEAVVLCGNCSKRNLK